LQDSAISLDSRSTQLLPHPVVSPGTPVGILHPTLAAKYGMNQHGVKLVAGTTDSNAAFIAATASTTPTVGTAVTSLGSTLAIKYLSESYVEDATRGVYSHRYPSVFQSHGTHNTPDDETTNSSAWWLVGGASNAGCAVLRQYNFSNEELSDLSSRLIDPSTESPLNYYPLTKPGERFPVADSSKKPVLAPVPTDESTALPGSGRSQFLHGILQGISQVECDGYAALASLGAIPPLPSMVWTSGGGSKNDVWTRMRQRRLRDKFRSLSSSHNGRPDSQAGAAASTEVVVAKAANVEASFGAAVLAAAAFCE
jgi:D-ribulokinase